MDVHRVVWYTKKKNPRLVLLLVVAAPDDDAADVDAFEGIEFDFECDEEFHLLLRCDVDCGIEKKLSDLWRSLFIIDRPR
mmetsp:Transcript_14072/g.28971  ORF Transcript_14072/g.28971 Transcript_14072/m.28971 type:complete len:80 (-) Transcript_14072:160-399(-)